MKRRAYLACRELKKEILQYMLDIKNDSKLVFDDLQRRVLINLSKKATKNTKSSSENSYEIPHLKDLLAYETFDGGSCVFENKTTQGFIIRVSHFTGMNERAKKSFKSLISNDIPAGCTVQVINYASPRIGDIVDYWYNSGNKSAKGSIYKKITEKRRDFFKDGSWQSIFGDRQNLLVRNFELYFCFSLPKALTASGKEENLLILKALQEKLQEGFKGIGSSCFVLDKSSFESFLAEILVPSLNIYKNQTIQDLVASDIKESFKSDLGIEMQTDRIKFGDCHYVTFEITEFPDIWDLESGINYIGQFDGSSMIPCPFYISYGFTMKTRADSDRIASKYRMIKVQQGNSKLPMFFPRMMEETHDWHYVSERINQGERLGKAVIYVVLLAKDKEQADKASAALSDHFARLKFRIEKVKYDTVNTFLATLPFGIAENWQMLDQLKVPSTLLSGAAMNLMPVFADLQNYANPLMMFVARRGQLFFFDNFKAADNLNGNFNMVIVGNSGRGKSVWMQEYTTAILRNGGQVIIIDDGRSFKNTCELFDGDFVDFGCGNFCINPFSLYREPSDTEDNSEFKEFFVLPFIDLVVSILCILLKIDRSNETDTKIALQLSVLENAIRVVIKKKGSSGGFKDIRQELLNSPEIRKTETEEFCNTAAYILEKCDEGQSYDQYFNGTSTLNITKDFTVFELSDLQKDLTLQNTVLMTVVFLVYAKMQGRERRTALMIDEFWRLGKHPLLKEPIEGFARRGRKYNLSLILASQCMSDFSKADSPAGAAALAQSDWRIMLSVDGKDEEMLKSELQMSPGEIEIARNLSGIKGAYSEFMIRHKSGSWQIGRLLLDPFSAKLYSTKAEDVAAIKKMRAQGVPVEEAIERLLCK